MSENFWDKVQKKAYYKYLDRKQHNLPDNSNEDWEDAFLEEALEGKIAEEAYLNYTKGYQNSVLNWECAKNDILDRIRFIAFYMHENNINKSPMENWKEAEKTYIENF